MKRVFLGFALAAATLLMGGQSAHADLLATEAFDYADGALVGNGSWATHSGVAGQLMVSGGSVDVFEDGSASEDASFTFTGAAGIVYYGIDFTVNGAAPFGGTDSEYFAHFKVAGEFDFSARMDITAAGGAGDFRVGIASDESTPDATWATDLNFGQTYRAVVGYDQAENIAQLWIDPTDMGDTSIMGEDRANPGDVVTQFALRQSNSSGDETITVDNIAIATTFQEALTGTAVPEPGSAMILFGTGIVGLMVRRRR